MPFYPSTELFPEANVYPGASVFSLNRPEIPPLSHVLACLPSGALVDTEDEADIENVQDSTWLERYLLGAQKVMVEL